MQNDPDTPSHNSNRIAISALIERWQTGDERAAQVLYDHFWDRTFWLAYGLLGDPDDALTQIARRGQGGWCTLAT